ncbi:hypothetical protein [Arthrobacter sp. Soil736]|uniref:hypothetical protein n=1 Tax=Arthrobacter sp. Soil736 TaxID=1736395 RepID=UPI001F11AF72|nr:hypothetical protein [Arthrobacter sp. Soil736]
MGNSGKTAVGAFFAALGTLVLTAFTLEEAALFAFLGAVAVGYVASVAEAFARRRYLALLAGGVGTSLFIGCSIAFLRMWGLAFNQDPGALGEAVTTKDSDIYFYLAAASGSLTLLVLFAAAVWPSGRRRRTRPRAPAGRPAPARASTRRPAAKRAAGTRQTAQRTAAQRQPGQRTPAPRTPAPRPPTPRQAAPRQPAQRTAARQAAPRQPAQRTAAPRTSGSGPSASGTAAGRTTRR